MNNDVPNGFKMTELGPLPVEWKVVKLGTIANVRGGYGFPHKYQGNSDGRYPFYKVSDMNTSGNQTIMGRSNNYVDEGTVKILKAKIFPENTLIFPKIGAAVHTNKKRLLSTESLIDNNVMGVTVTSKMTCLPKYMLFYFLTMNITELSNPGPLPSIKGQTVKNTILPLPPLPEQQSITRVLSSVQEAREKTEVAIDATRELKKSLMKHLFTYGPVPLQDADKVPLKETEIGLVPEEWNVVKLGRVTKEKVKNGAFIKRDRYGRGIPFLNVADTYKEISVNLEKWEIVDATKQELADFAIEANDLFFVRSSLKREGVGQCCIVEKLTKPAIFDCHLMRARVKESEVAPKFLAYYSLCPQGKNSLIARSKTTTMTTINQLGLSEFEFPLPPLAIQQQIAHILTSVDRRIETQENKKAALDSLFQTLLQNLMTAKIRVNHMGAGACGN